MIYKIWKDAEWSDLQARGETLGAPIDLSDGYIHFSTIEQVQGTLDKHFAGQPGLWLAAVDETQMGAELKWEISRGNALFPHLYRALRLSEILWCEPLTLATTGHVLPARLT